MPEPLVVIISLRLGRAETVARIEADIGRAHTEFTRRMTFEKERRESDRLFFRVGAPDAHHRICRRLRHRKAELSPHRPNSAHRGSKNNSSVCALAVKPRASGAPLRGFGA